MIPTHSEGLAAAKRVRDAIERGDLAEPEDSILMNVYQASLELRRIDAGKRMAMAKRYADQLIANTQESLD